jgi:hypothetical protein
MQIKLRWMLLLSFALCSCDRDKPQQQSAQNDPTTQAAEENFDNRPKAPLALSKTIQLVDYPLSLRVPEKWELKYGTVTLLQGPTPNGPLPDGMIHLIVSKPGPLPRTAIEALKPATRPATTKDSIARDEMRNLGPLRIYERRAIQPIEGGAELVKWTVSAYEPMDKDNMRVYQISFLQLSREHFEKDRQLLEGIIGSLAAVDAPAPAPSLAPGIQ